MYDKNVFTELLVVLVLFTKQICMAVMSPYRKLMTNTCKTKTFTASNTMTKTVFITPKQLVGDYVVSYMQIIHSIYIRGFHWHS